MDDKKSEPFEYPDEAGYPDGMGTLDEGTAGAAEGETTDHVNPDQPDADEAEPGSVERDS